MLLGHVSSQLSLELVKVERRQKMEDFGGYVITTVQNVVIDVFVVN